VEETTRRQDNTADARLKPEAGIDTRKPKAGIAAKPAARKGVKSRR
jgi:hypothetical protein